MSCNDCGADPVVMSVMDTIEYDTHALCADCVPGFALALAVNTNPGALDEDGRHKWVLALPEALHDTARDLHDAVVFPTPEASGPPAGPGPGTSDDSGPAAPHTVDVTEPTGFIDETVARALANVEADEADDQADDVEADGARAG